MSTFNRDGLWIHHGGDGRKPLYVQNGKLYDIHGKLLPNDVSQLNHQGYALTNEVRLHISEQKIKEDYRPQIEAIQREMDKRLKDIMEAERKELQRQYEEQRALEYRPLPADEVAAQVTPPLRLTANEKLLGSAEVPAADVLDDDEEDPRLDPVIESAEEEAPVVQVIPLRKARAKAGM